ncbi:hypothetical protein [Hymenobacter bucti]|uniref:STAS/SEC14 domain-containing protein n=1 Tax=Hymenobacter bucti TaxID=1844114 RepID=A0ABW4QV02_9BACT
MSSFYSVQYQTHPPLVRGLALRPLSVAEFAEACELLLAEAQRQQCPYWLLDGRADEHAARPFDMYEWLGEDFLPRVHRALGTIPCLAFLARPEFWQALQAQGYANDTPKLHVAFRANWFTDEAAAAAWLGQFRPPA